jgi:hypothetical protein
MSEPHEKIGVRKGTVKKIRAIARERRWSLVDTAEAAVDDFRVGLTKEVVAKIEAIARAKQWSPGEVVGTVISDFIRRNRIRLHSPNRQGRGRRET